ncbi:MAG: hypothetical protein EOM15_03630 [Spirochaetia bacterium]|nr:hypothetical protein [Spirochaetia bacterium]
METIAEYNYAKAKLTTLDHAVLVDALLKLAQESPSALMLVNGLISSQEERIALFRENMHSITHQGRRNRLSGEQIMDLLKRSLELLDPEQLDPKLGLALMEDFYSTDGWAFESTTELDFEFDWLYSKDGLATFSAFADRCPDADYVQEVLKRLLASNHYSARDDLAAFVT